MGTAVMTKINRREVLLGTGAAVVLVGAAGVSLACTATNEKADFRDPAAAQPTGPVDPEQRFVQLIAGGNGVIYGVQANGSLVWMRHLDWRDGGSAWAGEPAGRVIGEGWLRYRWVLASTDGQLFGIHADGTVTWHRYRLSDPQTGAGAWAPRSGTVIAERLGAYLHVFGGWDGVIYGVGGKSALFWHRYLANDGSAGGNAWARSGQPLEIGQAINLRSFAAPGGVIYDVRDKRLIWRRYTGDGSSASWTGTGKAVDLGEGWGDNRWMMAAEDGIIYYVDNARGPTPVRAGQLHWRKHTDLAAAKIDWSEPRLVGKESFTIEPLAALQGYASRLSARPGESIGLSVSTGYRNYTVSIVRLASGTQPLEVVQREIRLTGRIQSLPPDYRQRGCRWSEEHSVAIPADWSSGLYAARLQADGQRRFDIPFAVRPGGDRKAPIAYLWPTNTYNAYNEWGGHNQYTPGQVGKQRTCSFLRPSIFNDAEGQIDRRLTGDLLLLKWLSKEKIAFDCYHDADLHESGSWLSGYRAIVLAMHPEYWSENMRGNLVRYQERGGSIIYVGGDGLYERVSFESDGTALVFRNRAGGRDLYRNIGMPEHEILGVGYHIESHGTYAPYKVLRHHPLLDGTGLEPGDLFGERSEFGAASGWEVDRRDSLSAATADEVIAEGQNPRGGAELMFRLHPGGGWVFSAGSNTFTGALPYDAAVRRILRNVFDLALKNPQ